MQDKGLQAAALKLRDMIADLAGGTSLNTFVYPLDEIADGRQMKVVISTKYMDDEAIRAEVYFGKEWRNTLVCVRPKSAGDLTENASFLISAQRLRVCDDLKSKLEKDKLPQLAKYRQREEGDLRSKLKSAYGEWMKPGGRGDKIYFRPIECDLDTTAILNQVREAFGAEALDNAIRTELTEAAEEGKRFDELRLLFLKLLGKPVLVETEDLRKRARALCNEANEIVMVRGKTFYNQQNPAPTTFAEDVLLYLKRYGPSPPAEEAGITKPEHPPDEYPEKKPAEETEEAKAKEPQPGRQLVIRTEAHATPFSLQTDVEGKLRSGDRVTGLEVVIEGQGLEEAGSLSELLSELRGKGGQIQANLKLELTLATPQHKQEILKLLDRLPIPVDGQVRAILEVETDEAS